MDLEIPSFDKTNQKGVTWMKILSSSISEYRGSWVEQKGRKLIISNQERSYVFSLVCDSNANQDLRAAPEESSWCE